MWSLRKVSTFTAFSRDLVLQAENTDTVIVLNG